MSYGLSKTQRLVLDKAREWGYMTAEKAFWLWRDKSSPAGKERTDQLARLLGKKLYQASGMTGISAVYRLLDSLQRRGHLAQLCGFRPTIWVPSRLVTKKTGMTMRLLSEEFIRHLPARIIHHPILTFRCADLDWNIELVRNDDNVHKEGKTI